eukprot:CAMPEP_0201567870 /NCGR_PEP_ID=MMETSP0190_2-20130828/8586_1 /ASSEMBLY_ACC=CAM_ASM_000263 /TAXON_ID=37353 /ORGANISM="Rosalina sp." /LENGTH=400 /DNA_ID=CAMNT_0047988343 /DNA_START=20 /DNA_END=1222 /DNA_ORIENTATION=+
MTSRRLSYIVSACRTPVGLYNGGLSSLSAINLGTISCNASFDRCGVPKELVDEVIYGNVCSANLGQNPTRQISFECNLPDSATCYTVNKVCSSGLKAVSLASQSVELGHSSIISCGGFESMSNVPYYSPKTRFGAKMGNVDMIDGMLFDGLTCSKYKVPMGQSADDTAKEQFISRKKQDDFAIDSFMRAQTAYQRSIFDFEIIPIEIKIKSGKENIIISQDEGCWKLNEDKLRSLKPAFSTDGSVTAGNASQLSDGAASLIIVSEEKLHELNLKPLAAIIGYADAEQECSKWTTTPSIAIPKALERAGIALNDLNQQDFFEINEAFSVVALANRNKLKINEYNFNMYGGAVALGHPIGCSGARILVTLITALKENAGRYGIAGVCNGGGGATAMVIENLI